MYSPGFQARAGIGRSLTVTNFGNAVLSGAWFIVCSVMPDDDVLAAVEVNAGNEELRIKTFDWNQRGPNRWADVSSLEAFIAQLSQRVRSNSRK